MHEGRLLTVRHVGKDFLALPGGHLEFGEDVIDCIYREIVEELGIAPKIGRLLFVNTFLDGADRQPTEFFFEILNGADYLNLEGVERSHAHEIEECVWVAPEDDFKIKPEKFGQLFKENKIDFDKTTFLKSLY